MRMPWNKKSLANPDDVLLALFGGGAPTDAGVTITVETALRVPAVASAIRIISEAAASLSLKVMSIDEAGVETEQRTHHVAALLDRPNDWSARFDLIRNLTVDALELVTPAARPS